MAIVLDNDITQGLRGRIGKFMVFRSLRGKTIASHAPKKPDPRKQSAIQRQTRMRFREAAAWAVHTLRDPKQKHFYQDRAKQLALPNAYTAAVRDYMRGNTKRGEIKTDATLQVGKLVFDGKPTERRHHQPDWPGQRAQETTRLRTPHEATHSPGQEAMIRTPCDDTLCATEKLIRGKQSPSTMPFILPAKIHHATTPVILYIE